MVFQNVSKYLLPDGSILLFASTDLGQNLEITLRLFTLESVNFEMPQNHC